MIIKNSNRLSYALMTCDDVDLLFQLDQDVEVMRFINGGVLTSMEEINQVYIPRMESYTNEKCGWGLWKVLIKNSGKFIGWILVRPMNFFSDSPEFDNLELGWRFSCECWGKGYATEAAESIKQALISKGNIKKLSAIAVEGNFASIKIMRKLDMKYIKTYFHEDPLFSEEVVYYEINVN